MWSEPFTLHSDLEPSTSRGRFGNSRTANNWDIPKMRVQNNNSSRFVNEVAMNRGQRRHEANVSTGLDPEIQRHISFIQKQGKRNRGDEKQDQGPPTVSVSHSGMTLSDRFKMFMN